MSISLLQRPRSRISFLLLLLWVVIAIKAVGDAMGDLRVLLGGVWSDIHTEHSFLACSSLSSAN